MVMPFQWAFSAAVNIGSQYQNASFMDTAGKSSVHWQNFQLPTKSPWLPTSPRSLSLPLNVSVV